MALPVYQRRGIMYADLPRVETANLKESAAGFETINRRLDQLSSFISKKGTEYAQEQALQYAAQNPVTQQQINDAMSKQAEGQSWLSALTGGNVYDEALQVAQGSLLSNRLEIEATTRLNQLKVMAEAGQVDLGQAQVEIQDMIDGYTATISAFSPEAATKSRARMATDGNRVIDSIASQQAKVIFEAQKAQFEDGLTESQRAIEDHFFRGDQIDPETQTIVSAEARASIHKEVLLENAITSMQEGRVPAVYDMYRKARINGVAKGVLGADFASNLAEAYQKLAAGDMGKYAGSWAEMTDAERKEVKTLVYNEIGHLEKFEKQETEAKKKDLREEHYDLMDEVVTATPERREEIRARAKEINVEYGSDLFTDTQLEKIRTGDFAKKQKNKALLMELEKGIDAQQITREQISVLAYEDHIDFDDARKLNDRIKAVNNDLVKAELAEIKRYIEANKSPFLPSSVSKSDKARAISELTQRVKNGEDPKEAGKEIRANLQNSNKSKNDESIINSLKNSLTSGNLRPMLEESVRKSMQAEAISQAKEAFKDKPLIDETSTLRKFGAPGLGLGPRPEAVTITEEDILNDIVIDNLIDAMIENPSLINRWIKDKRKAANYRKQIEQINGAGE